jgi:toxin-antitoxin system PIN domain toxin
MGELPDANFWLALAWSAHVAHPVTKSWWEADVRRQIIFCRVTEMALLRLLTNRAILGDEAKTQAGAWHVYEMLRRSPRVEFFGEAPGFNQHWRNFSARDASATQRWSDDYLAAFARAHDLRVVTFDAGFRDYSKLAVELLVAPPPTIPNPTRIS